MLDIGLLSLLTNCCDRLHSQILGCFGCSAIRYEQNYENSHYHDMSRKVGIGFYRRVWHFQHMVGVIGSKQGFRGSVWL